MEMQIGGAAKRLILSLLLAWGVGGCAVYGPPYAAYPAHDTGYAPAYGYGGYSGYSGSSYYGGPAYAYPPVTLGLGFSYYDRGPRLHGRAGHHGRGHRHGGYQWRGHHGGHGHQHHGGHGRGHRRR